MNSAFEFQFDRFLSVCCRKPEKATKQILKKEDYDQWLRYHIFKNFHTWVSIFYTALYTFSFFGVPNLYFFFWHVVLFIQQ